MMDLYKRLPVSGSAPDSLVIFCHGLGANGQDLIGIAQYWANALPNTLFLSPDAPEQCDMAPSHMTGSRQWFSMQDRSEDALLAGVKKASYYLNGFIDHHLEENALPPERLALVGFSQGTMLSLYVTLRRSPSIACVCGYSGMLLGTDDLTDEKPNHSPIFLRHGEADEIVPVQAFHDAYKGLEGLNVDVTGETVPDLGHGIDDLGIQKGRDFLAQHLSS